MTASPNKNKILLRPLKILSTLLFFLSYSCTCMDPRSYTPAAPVLETTQQDKLPTMPVEETETQVILTHPSSPNTSVTVLKCGATAISWLYKGQEKLWLSEDAKLDGSKPVRGGIPLVFPVFGKCKDASHDTAPLPQHGFARNSPWNFLGQVTENPVSVLFGLGPEDVDPELHKLWGNGKHDYTLLMTVTLSEDSLTTEIEVENTGSTTFDFNWLFHTYHRVDDVTDTVVSNLMHSDCYDQLLAVKYQEKAPLLKFHEEFDRVYQKVHPEKHIQIIDKGRVLANLERTNLPDTVVWNPWIEKSSAMTDFAPQEGYLNMVCIEPGHVADFIRLPCGEKWRGGQKITAVGEINVQTNIYSA